MSGAELDPCPFCGKRWRWVAKRGFGRRMIEGYAECSGCGARIGEELVALDDDDLKPTIASMVNARSGRRVDTAVLLRIAARLEEVADCGSWQAETAGRIREAVEGESIPEQVRDVAYCPRCCDDGFLRIAPADAEGFELLRCAGCGRDYRYKRPAKGGVR